MENKNEFLETALIAGMIILVGEVVFGQAALAGMTELAAAGALLLLAAGRVLKGDKARARGAAFKALIFAALFVAGTALDVANKKIASSRAETIIAACRAYKGKTGAYPASLQALVPEYLPSVPRAKYTVLWGTFSYGEGRLAWMVVPMTLMPSYDLNAGKWSFALNDALPAVMGRL